MKIKVIQIYSFAIFLLFTIIPFNAAIKYYLINFNLLAFAYSHVIAMGISIFIYYLLVAYRNSISKTNIITLFILVFSVIIGFYFVGPFQVFVGIYIFIPFFFGLGINNFFIRHVQTHKKFYILILFLIISGVFLDVYIDFDWKGFEYSTQGLEISGNRAWTTMGIERLSGFSRSSFDAAIAILVLLLIIDLFKINKLIRLMLWSCGGFAILLTTTKGILFAYLVILIIKGIAFYLPIIISRISIAGLLIVLILLPLSTLVINYESMFGSSFKRNFTYSIKDRLVRSWPETLKDHSILGRGIGSIGFPQLINNDPDYSPGDNAFIYINSIFGIISLVIAFLFLISFFKKKLILSTETKFYINLTLLLLTFGITTNEFESGILAFFWGTITYFWFSKSQHHSHDLR